MRQNERITNTSGIESVMQFFLHEFCPILQSLLYDRRKDGLSLDEQRVLLDFILRIRFRAASLGDTWWYNWLRREKSIQARVKTVSQLFEKWCAVEGGDILFTKQRREIADELTEAITKLSKTYRNNIHLIRADLDLRQLEADIKYFDALRSLGLKALGEAVSSAFGEIFHNSKRAPPVVDRTDEPEEEEGAPQQRKIQRARKKIR